MTINVTSESDVLLAEYSNELGALSLVDNLTKQQEKRFAFVSQQIGLIKSGKSPQQIANIEGERLARMCNQAHLRAPISRESDKEWREWFRGKGRYVSMPKNYEVETRAQLAGTQSITYTSLAAGGAFVPMNFFDNAFNIQKNYDKIFDPEFCFILESQKGNPTTVPIFNDVNQASTQIGENYQSVENDFVAGVMQLSAYSFRSGIIYTSFEFLDDGSIPVGSLLEACFAIRHARGCGKALINGSGVAAPGGLVTQAVSAGNITIAAGADPNTGNAGNTAANSIGSADLGNLYGALDASYRPNAVFYMNDNTLTSIMLTLDKEGRPLLNIRDGIPTLFNKRIAICPSVSQISPSANVIVFADSMYFVQRRIIAGSYVRRFMEAAGYVEKGMVGFESWQRMDSGLAVGTSAANSPAAVLQMHS